MSESLALREKVQTIEDLLNKPKVKQQIARVIPKHLSPDRLLRVAMTSIIRTPKLLECTPQSLLGCIMTCAQLGLEPDQFLGQAYLVPFWNSKKECYEAQLIPGYRGYIALARRSGELATVSAHVVYEKDFFELEYGVEDKLTHKPAIGDRGEPIGAYAIFKFKDGSYCFTFMTKDDIEKIRARSKSPDNGPWVTDWGEMAKKTVIKRLAKLAPMSVEFVKASALEDMVMAGESQTEIFAHEYPGLAQLEQQKEMQIENLATKFDTQIPENVDKEKLNQYLQTCAEYFNKSIDEIKAEAVKNLDNFWHGYEKWLSKQASTTQSNRIKTAKKWQVDFFRQMGRFKTQLGDEEYYKILGEYGYTNRTEVTKLTEARKIIQAMNQALLRKLDGSAQK